MTEIREKPDCDSDISQLETIAAPFGRETSARQDIMAGTLRKCITKTVSDLSWRLAIKRIDSVLHA